MIARKEVQYLLQGGPVLSYLPREKFYTGYFCLQMAVNGNIKISFDGVSNIYKAPVIWVSYPGPYIKHQPELSDGSWEHRYLAFSGPLAQYWWQLGLLPKKPIEVSDAEYWLKLFDTLLSFPLLVNKLWDHEDKTNRLEQFFIKLAKSQPSESSNTWIEKAKRLLTSNMNFHPNIKYASESLNLGESTFRRRFKNETGKSPQYWFIEQRLETARELLEDNKLSISNISEQLGYQSIYQFSKQFKKFMHLSPRQWREAAID